MDTTSVQSICQEQTKHHNYEFYCDYVYSLYCLYLASVFEFYCVICYRCRFLVRENTANERLKLEAEPETFVVSFVTFETDMVGN